MIKAVKRAAALITTTAALFAMQISALGANAADAVWPVDSTNITTYFNSLRNVYNVSGYHNAIDIAADYGSPIYAAASGTVVSASWMDAYGYMVILWHPQLGVYTFYAHCSELDVSAGQAVSQGAVIAKVGSTGQSSGNHLHFGVCDTLLNGWPDVTYYDPLTYFTYGDAAEASACDCSAEYAGIYTTKDVTTYLNIRSGHGSSYSAIGQIPAGSQFKVTMGDGEWAHVEYNGVSGYCSMEFIEKIGEIDSEMSISGETYPEGSLTPGLGFSVRGTISSALPITRVWGGVYYRTGSATAQYYEAEPMTLTYDLNRYFDSKIIFNDLEQDYYTYRIEAEDSSGTIYTLVESDFVVGSPDHSLIGDINGDGRITVSDAVLLQNYLMHTVGFTESEFNSADINLDSKVNVFDMIALKKLLPDTEEVITQAE